jgi:hypothetical protein
MDRPAIPAELERHVLFEAGHRCAIHTCRQHPVEIAHIDPWEKVREHKFENLIALCPTCHDRYDKKRDIDRKAMLMYKQQLADGHFASDGVPSELWAHDPGVLVGPRSGLGMLVRASNLAALRKEIRDDHRTLLSAIWAFYRERKHWIPCTQLHRQFLGRIPKASIQSDFAHLGKAIVFPTWDDAKECYGLTFLGVLLTDHGEQLEQLLVRYLEHVKGRFLDDSEIKTFQSEAVKGALGLESDETSLLGRILCLTPFWGGSFGLGDEAWNAGVPRDVDDLAEATDVHSYIWGHALQSVAWAESVPVWWGIEWEGAAIVADGPLASLWDLGAEPYNPRAVEVLKAAGYDCSFTREDRISAKLGGGWKFAYLTDRMTWKRKLKTREKFWLMIREAP